MTITVAGPTPIEPSAADIAALARRTLVQATFNENQANPEQLFKTMVDLKISVQEMHNCLDHTMNIIAWMRSHGAKDGFQGLKVWSSEEIKAYVDWQVSQPNPISGGTLGDAFKAQGVDPYTNVLMLANVQAVLDTQAKNEELMPEKKAPWKL